MKTKRAFHFALRTSLLILGLLSSTAMASAERFVLSPDGLEVTDQLTDLIWRRCPEGTTWNGSTCSGTMLMAAWTEAIGLARAAADSSGLPWRLPNAKELQSIHVEGMTNPATDSVAFPGLDSHRTLWSSTPYRADSAFAWAFYTNLAIVVRDPITSSKDVLLVRSP